MGRAPSTSLRDAPLRGHGPGSYAPPTPVFDLDLRWAHHEYLQQAAEAGVVGLVLLLVLVAWLFAYLWWGRRRGLARTVAGATAVTLVALHATVDHVLHTAVVPLTLAVLVGWATADPRGPGYPGFTPPSPVMPSGRTSRRAVRRRISRSSRSDRRSMYSRSSSMRSGQVMRVATVHLRPPGEAGPDRQPTPLALACSAPPAPAASGRGPMRLMSPRSTFHSCGSSSRLVLPEEVPEAWRAIGVGLARVALGPHRAELHDRELLAVEARPQLAEEHGGAQAQSHDHGQHGEQRAEHDERGRRRRRRRRPAGSRSPPVEHPLVGGQRPCRDALAGRRPRCGALRAPRRPADHGGRHRRAAERIAASSDDGISRRDEEQVLAVRCRSRGSRGCR